MSGIDQKQLVTWFTDCLVAMCLTKASGTTTSAVLFSTSVGSQVTADTGLTTQEVKLATAITSGIMAAATQPSCSVHNSVLI